jgi:hypothetical protein
VTYADKVVCAVTGQLLKKMHAASAQRNELAAAARLGILVLPVPPIPIRIADMPIVVQATAPYLICYTQGFTFVGKTNGDNEFSKGALKRIKPCVTVSVANSFISVDLEKIALPTRGRFPLDLLAINHPTINSSVVFSDPLKE